MGMHNSDKQDVFNYEFSDEESYDEIICYIDSAVCIN